MSNCACEITDKRVEIDLLSNPFITQKWVPQFLCGPDRWKVFSGKWKTARPDAMIYLQEPEAKTGENISIIGSAAWKRYDVHVSFKILNESIKPPEGGAILYYNFRDMKNYYSLHFCHSKNKLELIKRYRGDWSTIVERDFDIDADKEYKVTININTGNHKIIINGINAIEVCDNDVSKGCIGIGIKYCDAEFSHVSILLH